MAKFILRYLALCVFLCINIDLTAQTIITFAGDGTAGSTGDGGPKLSASFNNPGGAYYDRSGNVMVVEYSGTRVRKITAAGIVSTFAGNGGFGFAGDGGPATNANFKYPIDILEDSKGNYYIVDNGNMRIRKVDTSGIISTFAGNGSVGYSGDGGQATNARLNNPNRIGIDPDDNIYIGDADNNVVRKVDTSGIITTVAGTGIAGFSGDGGPATDAMLNLAMGVAFDGNGNMYIADGNNHRIRKVSTSGIISTYAGNGANAMTGDGGPATDASLEYPNGVAVDMACNLYYSDWNGQKIRKITTSGIITTVVGDGSAGFSGDGGPATAAMINGPNNLGFDPMMNLYIPEYHNNRVRQIINLGESSGCPPAIPTASFSIPTDSVCMDSCLTFTNTSTGSIDSIRWVSAGSAIANPLAATTSICFPSTGIITVKLYVYGAGGEDSVSNTVVVSHCTTGVEDMQTSPDSYWISQVNSSTIGINSSMSLIEPLQLSLYNTLGKKIISETWEKGSDHLDINTANLLPGVYMIRLSGDSFNIVLKWVKQ